MLSVGFSKFIINTAYFSPLCPPLLYEDLMSILENVYQHHPEHTFLLYGDYNLLDISWSNDLHIPYLLLFVYLVFLNLSPSMGSSERIPF